MPVSRKGFAVFALLAGLLQLLPFAAHAGIEPSGANGTIYVLSVADAAGRAAKSATVQAVSEWSNQMVWVGKTDANGQAVLRLYEKLASMPAKAVPMNYTVRVFLHDEMGLLHLGLTQAQDASNVVRYERLRLQHTQPEPMPAQQLHQNSASTLSVDDLVSEKYVSADVKIGEIHIANGLRAQFKYGTGSVLSLDTGYKLDGSGWAIGGSYTLRTESITETVFQVDGTVKVSDGITYTAYGMDVYGAYTFRIRRFAHWLDCQGCNLGYFWTEITPVRYNGGGRVDVQNWYPSYDGATPAGNIGYIDRTAASYSRSFRKGGKWLAAFTIPTSWGTFRGGAEKDYYGYATITYVVPNWLSYYTRYSFYDWDGSGRMWWVTSQ